MTSFTVPTKEAGEVFLADPGAMPEPRCPKLAVPDPAPDSSFADLTTFGNLFDDEHARGKRGPMLCHRPALRSVVVET